MVSRAEQRAPCWLWFCRQEQVCSIPGKQASRPAPSDWRLTAAAVTLVSLEELLYAEMNHAIGGAGPDPRAHKQWEEQPLHHPLTAARARPEG